MNRPFALLVPAVLCLASQNPDREEWNTVEQTCGKVERLQTIPVKVLLIRSTRISRIALIFYMI